MIVNQYMQSQATSVLQAKSKIRTPIDHKHTFLLFKEATQMLINLQNRTLEP